MSPNASTLLNAAMALSEDERFAIAEALFSSLPDDADALDDASFEQELLRRSEEMKNDPSICIPWSELKKQC
jgi:putative addiction module component (TIGR02574 family)